MPDSFHPGHQEWSASVLKAMLLVAYGMQTLKVTFRKLLVGLPIGPHRRYR